MVFVFVSCESLVGVKESKAPLPQVHSTKFETIVDSLRYDLGFPALACAIVTDTGVVDEAVEGCRRYGGPANVSSDDYFALGSCTKALTAVLMGTLVDKGLVSWNTTLPEIFPEYKNTMREEYKTITVADILAHAAGLVRDPNIKVKSSSAYDRRKEIVAWALAQPPVVPKGQYSYSNIGYIIAGAITEKLTNVSYEENMIENVIKPLGITTAGFGVIGTEGKEDQPLQHTALHAPVIAAPNSALDVYYNPAGGLYMSVGDWAKYVRWVIKAAAGESQNLLQPETAGRIITPYINVSDDVFYGFGWNICGQKAGDLSLQHSGSTGYNYATAFISLTGRYAILLMSNQGAIGSEWPLSSVFWRIYKYHNEKN